MNQYHQSRRELLALAVFAVICVVIPAAFIGLHLVTPSDCARLSESGTLFTPSGAVITPYNQACGGWQDGDIVVEVAGSSMETWAQNLFRAGAVRPHWQFGQTITYGIVRDGELHELTLTLGALPLKDILANRWGALLFAFVSQLVATFVLLQKPDDRAARALFIWAMAGSHTYAWSFFLQINDITNALGFWLFRAATPGLWLIYWAAALHVALVFPKPLAVLQRRPWLIASLYILSFTLFFVIITLTAFRASSMLAWLDTWPLGETIVSVVFLLLTVSNVLVQYHQGTTLADRQRMRWVVYGASTAGLIGLLFWNIVPLIVGNAVLSANVLGLIMLAFPVSMAIAIWRHQLFDIDVIIRKTLVYSILTALLVFIYFSSIIFFQAIFRSLTDQETPIVIVISTLAIAALFSPLRRRIQYIIDRRFYRRKYDAAQTLAAFAQSVRNETDLDALTTELISVVHSTLHPEQVTIWMKGGRK